MSRLAVFVSFVCLCSLGLAACAQRTNLPSLAQSENDLTNASAPAGKVSSRYPGQLTAANGLLYGTTANGGTSFNGIIYSLTPSGQQTTLWNFSTFSVGSEAKRLLALSGELYGAAGGANQDGTVFAFDRSTQKMSVLYAFKSCANGCSPSSGVISVNGVLYGNNDAGGTANSGTVFGVNLSSHALTTPYEFPGGTGGENPRGDLLDVNGTLYGTTLRGGNLGQNCSGEGCGIVFSINLSSDKETVLHRFTGPDSADGMFPNGGPINVNGTLYGTTSAGGDKSCFAGNGGGCGTVYSIDPATGKELVIHAFKGGKDGDLINSGLTDLNGTLYGTASAGGANKFGLVYSVDPSTGTITTLYSFKGGSDGELPETTLAVLNGNLYGTTRYGGANGLGTVYQITPSGAEHVIYSF